jgi:xanthine dehydrogenase accessory factor
VGRATVVVLGSGDVGSAVAHLLAGSGYDVVIHDVGRPAAPRRGMAFTDAVFDGSCTLAGVRARRIDDVGALAPQDGVLLSTAPLADLLAAARPGVLVDARMRKRAQPEDQRDLAPVVIGLGPNFVAGETVDVAIETIWGEHLGAVITAGPTRDLSGEPRSFDGHARDRFVYAPVAGRLRTQAAIGQRVRAGEVVATIDDVELRAPLDGILRGLTHDGVDVEARAKVVEVDPRGDPAAVFGIGARPRRIAAGVLEAIRSSESRRASRGGRPSSAG